MSDYSAWITKNKALWTRVYDEVIAPDLEEEWKKRDEAYKKELKQKEENQKILFNHVENEVVKNSHLASENEQLRKQLELLTNNATLEPTADADHGPKDGEAGPASVSAEEHDNLVSDYNTLSKKYQDLSQKIKYLERKNNAVMQKNKDMKESVRAWQEYADRQSGKQKQRHKSETEVIEDQPKLSAVPQVEDIRPCIPSSPRSMAASHTPPPRTEQISSSPAPAAIIAMPDVYVGSTSTLSPLRAVQQPVEARNLDGSVTPKPSAPSRSSEEPPMLNDELPASDLSPKANTDKNAITRVQSHLQAPYLNSSQTTVDESAEQSIRHTELAGSASDDDDFPQVVSTRCLKRKRVYPTNTEICTDRLSDGTPAKPFRVKEEPNSSPPNMHSLARKETIDLDDPVSDLLKTPHRRRRQFPSHSTLLSALRHQRSSSAPFTQTIKSETAHSGTLFEAPSINVHLDAESAETRALSEPSTAIQNVDNVLGSLDPNIITESSTERTSKRARQYDSRLENLSASGKESFPVDANSVRLAPSVARSKLNRKLHGPSSLQLNAANAGQALPQDSTRIKVEQDPPSPSHSRGMQTPQARLQDPHAEARYITPDSRPQWNMKAPAPRSSARKTFISPPSTRGRLRSKPESELKLQDFRPNPEYNQGYSYAFSETVRKRGDRMCLPGCTNPQCCGSTFRTFAEAQGPLSPSEEEKLLEDYLGDAYDNMSMTQMSSSERQELILQARTRKMAKEAGKHREAYERRRTPPGFWRVDFPTTQEHEEDRKKAKEQERVVVHERWLEAQRKGGKWIFRDE